MSSRLDELRKAYGISAKPQTNAKPTATLMEQATGPQTTAAPKPAIVKPSVQAAREKQYGVTDGGSRSIDAIMPTIIKPSELAELKQRYEMIGREAPIVSTRSANAPELVSARPPEARTWFEKGAYADGRQKGDLWKTIGGTASDIGENVAAGLIGMGEDILDAFAYAAPLVAQGQFYQNGGVYQPLEVQQAFEEGISAAKQGNAEFIKKDLYDEETVAKKIIPGSEENSVLGEKSDALAQSIGQLLGTAALSPVVPGAVTSAVTAFGGQAETALNEGAGYAEAGASAAISAAAEALFENLSGAIKFGGKALDDVLTKQIADKITNKAWRTFAMLAKDAPGEGLEEVFSSVMSRLGTALYKEENLKELLASEEALNEYIESFIGGSVMGGGSSLFKSAKQSRADSAKPKIPQTEQQAPPTVDSVMPQVQQEQAQQQQPSVDSVMPQIESKAEPNIQQTAETAVQFDDGSKMTKAAFVAEYTKQFPRATAAEATEVFDSYKTLNEKGFTPPAFETQEVQTDSVSSKPIQKTEFTESERVDTEANPAMGAADSGFDPYSHASLEHGAIEPGENPARVVDVPKSMDGNSNVMQTVRTIMEADATPDTAIPELEQAVVNGEFSRMPITDQAAAERAEGTIRRVGYQQALADWRADVQSGRVGKDSVAIGETLYNAAVNAGDTKSAVKIAVDLATQVRSAAQALQAVRMLKKMSPAAQLYGVKQSVDNLQKTLTDKYGKRAPDLVINEELAAKFLEAQTDADRSAAEEALYQDIAKQIPTTFSEIANKWRYTAMLFNPATHIKNMSGNATQLAEATVKDAIAAVGEGAVDFAVKAIRKGRGIQRTKALLNPLNKTDAKLLEQAGDDYANVMEAILDGSKWKDTAEGKISKYKTDMKLNNPHNVVGRAVDATLRGIGKVSDFNERAMNVEDSWFAKPRYQAALAGYMKANNLTEITDAAREYAIQEAKKSTYRDSNAISDFVRSMGNSGKKNWVTKSVDFFVNAIFPFKGTPANVGVRAVEYSPAGLIATISKGAYNAAKGQFNASQFIDDLSANITGSALMGVGIWLAQLGILRAKGAEDEKEKEQLEKEGYKDNSINVFGYSVPISAIGAGSVPLLLGAAVYENFVANNPGDEGHPIDDFLSALSGTLDPVLETTMLTGFQDAIQSFQQYDPEAEIGETLALGAVDIAGNYIASFIPTLLSRAANSTDTSARQIYVDKNKDAQAIRRVLQTLQKKIPGLRNQMTEVVDAYGNTVEGGLPSDGSLLERVMAGIGSAVTPIYGSKIKTTAVDEEIRRLYNAENVTGDYTLITPDVPRSFEVGNKTAHLTGDQYVQYQKTFGASVQAIRGGVMSSEAYKALPDDVKAAAMNKAYEYANALAKTMLDVGYKPNDQWTQELFGASPELVAQTIIEKSIDNAALDKDKYSNKYLGLEDMLETNTINDQVALACMSESSYTAYTALCKPAGVSVSQFLDMYGTAYASGENDEQRRSAALENIQKMDIPTEQKTALAQAAYNTFKDYISKKIDVPDQWLLDNGDIATIENQMSDTQAERYNKYIKDSSVDMQTYIDFHAFAGETEGSDRKNKIIAWLEDLDATDEVKGRLFCTIYSRSSCPLKWRTGVPRD